MKSQTLPIRVAFVYDRVNTPFGGAERVLLALHKLFPHAPLYTSVYDLNVATWAEVFNVRTSYLQEIPFAKQKHRELLPLMPSAFEHLNLSKFDLVISITSAEAKGVRVNKDALHISYLLTPSRYLWSHTYEYQTGILKLFKIFMFSLLRRWDYKAAQQPDLLIPISKIVAQRTQKYYRRKPEEVIYPPFSLTDNTQETENFHGLKDYYLVVARLVSYKKVDMCIQACQKLDKQLVIVGDGPDHSYIEGLIKEANKQKKLIHWFTQVNDNELSQAYKHAKAFLLPAEEDFGITALEAQACGIPVMVFHRSGGAEVVQDKITGLYMYEQSIEAMQDIIQQCEKRNWDSDVIKSHTAQYNEQSFIDTFEHKLQTAWQQHVSKRKGQL